MRLEAIHQYPVKSMMGGLVASAALTVEGLEGDRAWAVRDDVLGCVRGAKDIGALMQLGAAHAADGGVTITLPDGRVVHSSEADVNESLSGALGKRVSLWPLPPATDLEHDRRGAGVSDDSDPSPGTYVDAYPLMLMTTSAMRTLTASLPDSVIDVRRFRPNLIIDTGDVPGNPELGWVGRTFSLGSAVIEMATACPRCVMVTREINPQIPADRSILRHIVRDLDQCLGIYANVVQAGEIRTGDNFIQL